jgi:hypothetical protein
MKKTIPKINLIEMQESFEELGRDMPALPWKDAVLKLGRAKGLVDAEGKPIGLTARDFLRFCLKDFRRGQRDARRDKPAIARSARKLSKKQS